MTIALRSIRFGGSVLLFLAFALGLLSAGLWLNSSYGWHRHLQTANHAGQTLYDSLHLGADLPDGMRRVPLSENSQVLANTGKFGQIPNIPRPSILTYLTFDPSPRAGVDSINGAPYRFVLVSPDLQYPISELSIGEAQTSRAMIGEISALMARYCSDAALFVSIEDGRWSRFEGDPIWGCESVPSDLRLMAVLVGLLSLFALSGLVMSASTQFSAFAEQLRSSRQIGGLDKFRTDGLAELKSIIEAVNSYRDMEWKNLAERALVLSGVTHDLGTPAMRIKLRASLIEDESLKTKLMADVDQMTDIIESVLTFTRSELSVEEPRSVSLTALVQSIVDDYIDMGRPVEHGHAEGLEIEGGSSVFMSRKSKTRLPSDRPVILSARPVALRRAITNLIDNALKYGRRAKVKLTKNATHAQIVIEDEGGQIFSTEFENMIAPFKRGGNATLIQGFGLGLTIASAIAQEHGGSLSFQQGPRGLKVTLSITR